jgi:hypothetical protein
MPLIERIVAHCTKNARLIVGIFVLAAVVAAVYTSMHFQIDTNSEHLVSAKTHWRRREIHFDKLFPQQNNLTLVVIDGVTPELAEAAAAQLTAKLQERKDLFPIVRRPDGGAFFDRNGMLFLSTDEVKNTTQELVKAQPLLGVVAADPSLRGVMDSLAMMLQGVTRGDAKLEDIRRPIAGIGGTLARVTRGENAYLSWRSLVTGAKPALRETRRFIEVQPKLDYGALEPGKAATDVIRADARLLNLTPDHGVTVRLTGPVPLSDEEFATITENAGVMVVAMFLAVLLTLWLAVRSFRIIFCIFVTLFTGLALTMGIGIAMVGVFNIISIAFIALFVGLGVDFAVQFSVRYRAERHAHPVLAEALGLTGRNIGIPLALAAAATAAGFLSFLPTNYVGVAELGLISGIGMIIAFVLSVTMLPALLMLVNPPGEPEQIGYSMFAPIDRFLTDNRTRVLQGTFVIAIAAIALLPGLRFDSNPLDLRNPKVESVATLFDLMRDPDNSPNTVNVLAPSIAQADQIAAKLAHVPEAGQIVTLKSLVPDDQAPKLAAIQDADTLLDPTINPFTTKPPPTDADTVAALKNTAAQLRAAAATDASPAKADALGFAKTLDALAQGSAASRARASDALVPGLNTMLNQVRASLTPESVSIQTMPKDLVRDWVATDGSVRVQVFPRTDARDNAEIKKFADAILEVAPGATGTPVSIQNYGSTIVRAFIQAGVLSALVITALLLIVLRRIRDTVLTLVPLFLTGVLTLATCVVIGLQLNFANVIALPLLFGVGVAFDIYFIVAWRDGQKNLLQSSLTRAVIFSAATTASGFGTLWLSSHHGTASMGELLMISLGWTLVTTLFFLPALLPQKKNPATA